MQEVYVVSAVRTPIGCFGGALSGLTATQLGSHAIKNVIDKIGITSSEVQEVIMGNVLSANLGQAPARQAALGAGLGFETRCTTINKVCSSGMKAIMYAAQNIMMGITEVAVAGGMESMSNVPHYIPKARFGYKYGGGIVVDGLEKDGLLDPYEQYAMGYYSDLTARKFGLSRKQQDDYAIESYKKAINATDEDYFANEVAPIEVTGKNGIITLVSEDEELKNINPEKITQLKPAFDKKGTATAANSSKLSDGASAVVLMTKRKADKLGLRPIAKILGFIDVEQEPAWFTTAPTVAVPKLLQSTGLSKYQIDAYEVNEAFSSVPLVFQKSLELNPAKINQFGGSVALGHPLGSSGARIVGTLLNVLTQTEGLYGIATICNGGGGASAMAFEKI